MKTRQSASPTAAGTPGMPDADSLAALRAWYEGLSAREAVARYLGQHKGDGESSRGVLGRVRRQLAACAKRLRRDDLAAVFTHPESE